MKISVFKSPPLKSHPAHFSTHTRKVSVSQLAKALSMCMLPIRSRIFPMRGPRLRRGAQRGRGALYLFVFSFSPAVRWTVCRTSAAGQDINISEY